MTELPPLPPLLAEAKPATPATKVAQQRVRDSLPFSDRRSFENASRGRLAGMDPVVIKRANGQPVYDLSKFDFLNGDAPDEVNPSLWRQAQLNALYTGLFEVVPGIYQVRGYDMANMTLIQGERGWIIIDPLTAAEVSAAALQLANETLGERPVTAVLHTHSHVDHYAGVYGVISPEQAASGEIPIVAPEHFVEEALNENVVAGNVMGRRATYMYGNLLVPGEQGFVSNGLGATLALGSTGFAVPNDLVRATGETRVIDGVEFDFQMTPGTEAPAEFVFYLPGFNALCMSEITSHHMHNVYTPRGAQVRDALEWSAQIQESIDRYGDNLEVEFASHHWPTWGRAEALEYLGQQRDLYKYIHDQTMRLANKGLNKEEIAEELSLPESLGQNFANRGYYGSLSHNSRAVYVKYLGYFDANPANLNPLPPKPAAQRYLDYMGGVDKILEKAQQDFDRGDYRWVAEVLNHVVIAQPDQAPARALLADTYEQLGYQAESGPWRNFYLCGALELRQGLKPGSKYQVSRGVLVGIPMPDTVRLISVQLDPKRLTHQPCSINLELNDGPACHLRIENSVLHYRSGCDENAQCTLAGSTLDVKSVLLRFSPLDASETVQVRGTKELILQLINALDDFPRRFPIVSR